MCDSEFVYDLVYERDQIESVVYGHRTDIFIQIPTGLAASRCRFVHDVVSHKKGRLQLNVNKLFLKGCASQIVLAF